MTSTSATSGRLDVSLGGTSASSAPSSSPTSSVTSVATGSPTTSSTSLLLTTSNSAAESSTSSSIYSAPTPSSSSTSTNFTIPGDKPKAADNQGLSSGAVAGIGVGTFFVGVLLALLGVCLVAMLRKKKRRPYESTGRPRRYRDSEHSEEYGTPMKGMTSTAQPVGAGNDINMNRILLEPVSSSDIKADMLAIGSLIVQHVDNNYHLKPVDSLPANFADTLKQDGYSAFTGISIEQLGNLLRNVQTRRAAIKHLISYFIFSKLAFTGNVESSLLPGHVIAFLKQIPPPERTSGSREAFDQAITKWRRLSAYLLQTVRSSRDPLLPQDNDIQPAITRNVAAVRQILAPFVIPGSEKRQAENLQGLMAEGAKLGLLLFQHPETWIVDWEVPRIERTDVKSGGSAPAKASAIVVFPGLVKTADEDGKRYGKVRTVLDAEILQI